MRKNTKKLESQKTSMLQTKRIGRDQSISLMGLCFPSCGLCFACFAVVLLVSAHERSFRRGMFRMLFC